MKNNKRVTKEKINKLDISRVYIVAAVLVLILVGFLIYNSIEKILNPNMPSPQKLPEGITRDMILDDDAAGFMSTVGQGGGRKASAVRYVSSESIREIYGRYLNYLLDNNWSLASDKISDNDSSYLFASKNGFDIEISISNNPEINLTAVTLDLLK